MKTHTDCRLQSVYEQIDRGAVQVLSIDIFDTLLWRKVLRPNDLFLILGKHLKEEGWLIEAVPAEKFRDLRCKAELLARFQRSVIEMGGEQKSEHLHFTIRQLKKWQRSALKEVTLKEIYWQLQGIFQRVSIEEMVLGKKGIINEADVDEIVSLEVALECNLCGFDPDILQMIEYAHSKKILVVLISNTYFEMAHIQTLLKKLIPKTLPFIHKIYLSCEHRCGKGDGLFLKMLDEMQIAPNKVLHLGDNIDTDVLAAKQAGLLAAHYPKYDDAFEKALAREWPEVPLARREKLLDKAEGDYGLTALRSKLCFDAALLDLPKRQHFFWKYGATILGPLITSFVHWIYDRCKDLGEAEPLCVMREGRLYGNMINAYAPYYSPFSLHPKELWASRHFITSAAVFYGNANELLAVAKAHPLDRFTVESFCLYLGVDALKIRHLARYAHVKLDTEDFKEEIASNLSCHPAIVEEILRQSHSKRQRFLKYLGTLVDLETAKKIVLVDVGWSGTIQSALQAILAFSGYAAEVHGLYLATNDMGDRALLQGHVREGFLFKAGYPSSLGAILVGSHYPLEKVAVTEIGPLLDIDEQGRILTREMQVSENQRREVAATLQGIYAFCDRLGAAIQSKAIVWDSRSKALQEQLRAIFVGLAGRPTSEEAKKLGKWNHDLVTRDKDAFHTLAEDAYYGKFIGDMLPVAAFHDANIIWPAAYAAQKDATLAQMAEAALLKTLPVQVFLSTDSFLLEIFLNRGKGFSLSPFKRLKLRSNPNRHFYVLEKIESLKKPIRGIRLRLHAPKALVKIISLKFIIHEMDHPRPKEIVCNLEDLSLKAQKAGASGAYFCKEKLDMTYAFAEKTIYFVQINLCLGILE